MGHVRHKNILLFPQILKAANPPLPFKYIKQCVGQYVVTFPGVYHMVLNSGYNICEGLNFSVDRWTQKYAKKERRCTCDLKPKPKKDVPLSFKTESFYFYQVSASRVSS
jgi:jumonji domain-containing protein 2